MEQYRVGDVAKVRNGYAFSSDDFQDEGIPVIRMSDLDNFVVETRNAARVPDRFLAELGEFKIDKGDLIVGMSGSIGKVAVYQSNSPALQNQRVGVFKILSNDELDFNYLKFFSLTLEKKLLKLGKGVAIKNVSAQEIEDLPIPLPPLPEQRCIAALLNKTDHLRRTRRYAAQLSDTFLQAVFVRMFGNSGEVERTIIQELLDEGAILDLQDGNHGEAHPRQSDFVTEGIPFLTATHVIDGKVFLNRVPRINHEKAKQLRIGWVEPYDVLLAHNATVGRVAVLPNFEGRVVIGTSLTYYRLNQKHFNPAYFAEALRSRAFQSQLEQSMGQSTRNQVPITRQKELWVPVAPLALQQKFAYIVQQFERLRAQQREAERQAEHLFQTLLHRAFSGGG